MAETTKRKAIKVCKKMGLVKIKTPTGEVIFKYPRGYIYCADSGDQYALAMLCVAEGVRVAYFIDKMGDGKARYAIEKQGKLPIYCTRKNLIRTIYDVYLEGER